MLVENTIQLMLRENAYAIRSIIKLTTSVRKRAHLEHMEDGPNDEVKLVGPIVQAPTTSAYLCDHVVFVPVHVLLHYSTLPCRTLREFAQIGESYMRRVEGRKTNISCIYTRYGS